MTDFMSRLPVVGASRPHGPLAKPLKRSTVKAKKRKVRRVSVKTIRDAVFERDHYACVVCGKPAESMHERVARSLGGQVNLANSIAVCGDGVRGCHGKLQRHEISLGAMTYEELCAACAKP